MTKLVPTALLLGAALLATLPGAAAAIPQAVCDATGDLCYSTDVPEHPQEQHNADGSYTVSWQYCSIDNWCDTQRDSVTTPATENGCFAYNPDALTNACVQTSGDNQTVPAGYGGLGSKTVCIVGDFCEVVPEPVITSGPTTVSLPSGYVEPTAVCKGICHLSF